MTLDERLKYCKMCLNRKMNPAIGLVCGLTNEKPAFEGTCPVFKVDQPEADRLVQLEKAAVEGEDNPSWVASPERKAIKMGVAGGLILISVAVVWFVVGLMAGYLFYYPPILLIIGVYALIKGMIKKNIAGEK